MKMANGTLSGTMTRYPELDVLRTFAVFMMIVFHLGYDLSEFYGWNIRPFEGGWSMLQISTASLFLLLVGAGFAISWSHGHRYQKYLRRGLGLIAIAMGISLVTYVINPETYIRFGVLHLIGTGILLLPFFARLKEWNVIPGVMMIAAGQLTKNMIIQTSLLVPLGLMPAGFSSVDYFPLIPWFGLMLIGYSIGYFFYVRRKKVLPTTHYPLLTRLCWPSRHALVIYLVHG
jgi:uncharacterized membrane protein